MRQALNYLKHQRTIVAFKHPTGMGLGGSQWEVSRFYYPEKVSCFLPAIRRIYVFPQTSQAMRIERSQLNRVLK